MSGWNMPPGVTTRDIDRASGADEDSDYILEFRIISVTGKAVQAGMADKVIDYLADGQSPLADLDGTYSVEEMEPERKQPPS